ncbi:MAG: AAA family ATPase, partial [Thermodesulfobacteriota bacterium]
MPILTLFSGAFCNEKAVTEILLEKTGYRLLSDSHIASEAARLSGMDTGKIERALTGKVSVFNKFTHEKERAVASMKLALAESLEEEGLFVSGFCTHLIPREITHALRVCLIAEMNFRRENAARQRRISEKEALNLIHKRDEVVLKWIWYLYGEEDPWDPAFYDIMIPMDKHSEDEAVSIVLDNLDKDVLNPTARSRQAVEDFKLAARVGVALAREGHDSDVSANNGDITLVINKNVLMLSRLEEDLKAIVSPIEGVKSVRTKVGQDFYKTDIYRKYDFEPLNKVLLVDDEREFVQTLSERL